MTRTRVNRPSPSPPKRAVFKGEARADWIAFQVQFDKNTSRYEWSNEEKLSKLVEFLRDSYYSRLHERECDSYNTLIDWSTDRYGRKDPPHTLRQQLQSLKQMVEEDLESFAEGVQ